MQKPCHHHHQRCQLQHKPNQTQTRTMNRAIRTQHKLQPPPQNGGGGGGGGGDALCERAS